VITTNDHDEEKMATAEQIKALLRSHADRDEERFFSTALQVAANEARIGHHRLAEEIKSLVVKAKSRVSSPAEVRLVSPSGRLQKNELDGLLQLTHPAVHLSELVLADSLRTRLTRIIFEQRQKDRLASHGLHPRRKVLFTGPPGTGKTICALALAAELRLPLYRVVLDGLITRYMGETAAKLRLIFDHIQRTRAVYLFDEFDAIGTQRGASNDVGEIRRVLNSFLILVEQDSSESLIVAATNHPELLDRALHRRFDDIIAFEKPASDQIEQLLLNRLNTFDLKSVDLKEVVKAAVGLSCADVVRAADDAAKEAILHRDSVINSDGLLREIEFRKHN
jgi:SpoVK/Ycf46/Vps4 family AAA+-type ATPase